MTCKPIFKFTKLYNDIFDNIENIIDWHNLELWHGIMSNKNAIPFIEYLIFNEKIPNDFMKYAMNGLCTNINASHIISIVQDNLNEESAWAFLSTNLNAMSILKQNVSKISWSHLCLNTNPDAVEFLTRNVDKIDWVYLSCNDSNDAIQLLEENYHEIEWYCLSSNSHAIRLIEKNIHLINWSMLSSNANAFHLLESNQHLIDYASLLENKNPSVLHFVKNNIDKFHDIDLSGMMKNPTLVPLIEELFSDVVDDLEPYCQKCINIGFKSTTYNISDNEIEIVLLAANQNAVHVIEKILPALRKYDVIESFYLTLLSNPSAVHLIYTLDFKKMFENNKQFKYELTKKVFEPNRLNRICKMYNIELIDYVELFTD
jgi:hypothetical protein